MMPSNSGTRKLSAQDRANITASTVRTLSARPRESKSKRTGVRVGGNEWDVLLPRARLRRGQFRIPTRCCAARAHRSATFS